MWAQSLFYFFLSFFFPFLFSSFLLLACEQAFVERGTQAILLYDIEGTTMDHTA